MVVKVPAMILIPFTIGWPRSSAVPRAAKVEPCANVALSLVLSHGVQLVILVSCVYFLVAIILQEGYSLLTEDQLFEYWTAAFYLASALLCLLGPRVFGSTSSATRYWLMVWGVLFLLVALEEISWGQRILGIDTPDFLVSRNLQKETNLHNLDSEGINRLFASFVFAVGVALPSLILLNKRLNSLLQRCRMPLPQSDLVVPFSLAFAIAVPNWVAFAPEAEVLIGLTALWFAFVLMMKWGGSEVGIARINTLHLLAGLLGIVAIQVVLSVFEGNLGHRSHPSEIKEFLFSACFLVFSFRVSLPGMGNSLARLRLL